MHGFHNRWPTEQPTRRSDWPSGFPTDHKPSASIPTTNTQHGFHKPIPTKRIPNIANNHPQKLKPLLQAGILTRWLTTGIPENIIPRPIQSDYPILSRPVRTKDSELRTTDFHHKNPNPPYILYIKEYIVLRNFFIVYIIRVRTHTRTVISTI